MIKEKPLIFLLYILTCLVSLCAPGGRLYAQQYYFKHYSIEDGLAQSQIMSIYQDNSHYLWFGTASGVSRFNGTDFVNYAKINGIHGNSINSIYQDKGRILFRTGIGISSLESNHITKLFIGARPSWNSRMVRTNDDKLWLISGAKLFTLLDDKLTLVKIDNSFGKVQAITLDNEGNIYAAVFGEGIFCRLAGKWTKKADLSNYKDMYVMSILFDKFDNSKMYLLSSNKLYQVAGGTIQPFQNAMLDNFKGEFMGLEQGKDGAIWVGSSIGAFYINKNTSIHFTHANGFTNNPVTAIYCDKEDIIWLATDGDGFYKFQGLNLVSYQMLNDSPLPLVTSIQQDKSDNLWVGTYGDGLIKIDDDDNLTSTLLPSADPNSRIITCMGYREKQDMLIGTAGGLWALKDKSFYTIDKQFVQRINTAIYDSGNRIWAGTAWGCFYLQDGHFVTVKGETHSVISLCSIGKDSVLAGTYFGLQLIVKNQVDEKFEFKQLNFTAVLSILKVNNLAIAGTFGEGMYLIDVANHRLKNISSLDGLKSNDVYSLMTTDNNTIWAGTGKGIDKFRINEKQMSVNLIHNLIPNPVAEYNQGAILKYKNKVWLGSNKGIVAYNLLNSQGNHKPVLNIEGINITDQSGRKEGDSLLPANDPDPWFKFPYSNNRITIFFKGIYFTDPDNLTYQYRLRGLENRFSELTKSNSADYTSLKPGKYWFEVRVVSALGTKSDIKSIAIEIIPAFYQTTWFYVLMFILLIVLIVLIQQYIIYHKKQQKALHEKLKREEQIKIREQTAEDFHDDIGNKLTRIAILADVLKNKTLSENGDQQKLIDQIKENATALYTDTKDILWALDPQSENLVEILAFIKNLAVDIFSNTGITLEFNQFDFKENKFELPLDFSRNISMIFREVLHNILKHAGASKVVINCCMNDQKITIELQDNGKGFDTELVKEGKGLNNIRMRAWRINGEIEIGSVAGRGTDIKLHFNTNGKLNGQ